MVHLEIARICFHRSICSPVSVGSAITAQLSLHSEFSGVIPDLMKQCKIIVKCLSINGQSGDFSVQYNCRVKGDICIFRIELEPCSSAQLEFTCVEYPEGFRILPLLSEEVVFCDNPQPAIICTVYRPLVYTDFEGSPQNITIKEDRGLTMGSHLWDSSVVVFDHFNFILSSCCELPVYAERKMVGVELGGGCGLTAIQMGMSKMFSRVYCSDLRQQIPLMKENIILNGVDCIVAVDELDWCDASNVQSFKMSLGSHPVDVIFAADVLYQHSVFEDLLGVIRSLSLPGHTVTFIAQKLRGQKSNDSIDMTCPTGFSSVRVVTESNVIIWRLVMSQV